MDMAENELDETRKQTMIKVAKNCKNISEHPVQTFHEAVQSTWFLFVILQMESNASSFSPGRLDRHLEAYYEKDIKEGNKKTFTGSREELIKEGYIPCGRCKP